MANGRLFDQRIVGDAEQALDFIGNIEIVKTDPQRGSIPFALVASPVWRESDPPSLVMTDVHMGDGNDFDLVRTLREDPLEFDPRTEELGLDDSNFILRLIEPVALVAKIEACLTGSNKVAP